MSIEILRPTHTLAWTAGADLLVAACPIGGDISAVVRAECPSDVAEAWEADGYAEDVILTVDLIDEDVYDMRYDGRTGAVGFLPDPFNYAWTAR